MASGRPIAVVPDAEADIETPLTKTFHLRGHEYVVRELTSDEYEKQLRSATSPSPDGSGREQVDMLLLEKQLSILAVKRDGQPITPDFFATEPYPLTQRVVADVKVLNWADLETDEEISDRRKAEKEEKAKAPNS